jgi:hypothetical protein
LVTIRARGETADLGSDTNLYLDPMPLSTAFASLLLWRGMMLEFENTQVLWESHPF